jgi:hypothetical protein
MTDLIDEQLLRRALLAYQDVRPGEQPAAPRRIRPMRLGAAVAVAALVIAGSALAAERIVLQPLGVFALDARDGPVGDRDFIVAVNASGASPEITRAGLVLQHSEDSGEVRVYATTNADGSHGIAISEDGNPAGLGCCAEAADLTAPLYLGLQLGRSVSPVAYPDAWAGWVGDGTVSVRVRSSDGSETPADVAGGYFLAIDHTFPGSHPIALVAYAADGSELGRLPVSRG